MIRVEMIKTISYVKFLLPMFSFLKNYNTKVKAIKRLNIRDKSGYFFVNMTNIDGIDPELLSVNDFKGCKDGSITFDIAYDDENNVPHIVFNNIECIFRKSDVFSNLMFCESDKNEKLLNRYVKVIDKVKEEILSFIDEFEDDLFIMGKDFMRFRFKTDDKLVYNQKVYVPVCVISVSSVAKKGDWYYPQFKLQEYFYEISN